jgi:hypothetical protein
MPVEGHAQRVLSPLKPRDRHFLAATACAVVLGIGVSVYLYTSRTPAPSNKGCVVVTIASSLGGTTLRNCGTAAHSFCRAQAKLNGGIAAACREQGFAPEPTG